MSEKKRTGGKTRKRSAGKQKAPGPKKTGAAKAPAAWIEPAFELGGRLFESAVDEAQDVMYDAWDAPTRKRRVALARKALEISADCADAYVLLAEETAKSLEEATELYRQGVAAGERALGPKTFEEDAGYFWGLIETRPYMRARHGLARCLWDAGRRDEAVAHYRDMLRLNPDDNQGVRYALATCLLVLERDDELAVLLKEYEMDASAAWLYTAALLAFRQEGDTKASRKALTAAVASNGHVPAYLMGAKKLPRTLPAYYSPGEDTEAVCCAADNADAWRATPGALDWLARNAG